MNHLRRSKMDGRPMKEDQPSAWKRIKAHVRQKRKARREEREQNHALDAVRFFACGNSGLESSGLQARKILCDEEGR